MCKYVILFLCINIHKMVRLLKIKLPLSQETTIESLGGAVAPCFQTHTTF